MQRRGATNFKLDNADSTARVADQGGGTFLPEPPPEYIAAWLHAMLIAAFSLWLIVIALTKAVMG